jgi:hypothetical protein
MTLPLRRSGIPLLFLVALAVAAAPASPRAEDVSPHAEDGSPPRELVAEALFLCDSIPPGGRDVNLSVALQRSEDPETGDTSLVSSPRLQLALGLGERLGLTADVGLETTGDAALDTPGASLKLLLRDPGDGRRTGLSASLDLFGSTHSLEETEAGLGLGAIRAVGPVALRAAASVATGVRSWSPHVHAGLSAALALGARWRALAEVVADVRGGEAELAAGPTLKLALGERTALMAGALFEAASPRTPLFTFQLTRSM